MCGIFGYIGKRHAAQTVIEGLKRLEYRGYDSWGVAVAQNNTISVKKEVGAIKDVNALKDFPESVIGVGHTRWATHGGVKQINAHPHFSTDKSFVLAQNGIVENYQELKSALSKEGYKFDSETDTEVIVRLIENKLKSGSNLREAVRLAFIDLEGRNTIIVLTAKGDQIISVRNGSPLVIGLGNDEIFFASDTLSFADKADKVIYIDNLQMAEYVDGDVQLYDVKSDKKIKSVVRKLDHDDVTIDKEGYEHFMLKEIVEQKHTIREAIQYSEAELKDLIQALGKARTVYTVGAGTASFAAGQIAYFLRKHAGIKAIELTSYEVESYRHLFSSDDLLIAVSQSGETADTIEAVEYAKNKGVKIASIVNMLGSSLTRMSDYKFFSRTGPEICVASTKAYTAQCAWGLLIAFTYLGKYDYIKNLLTKLGNNLVSYFGEELFDNIKKLAVLLEPKEHFFVLGKGQNFYTAREGALKVKEITYKHFEGFAAGELKHGVIALIEKGTPVFVIVSEDEAYKDMLSAAAEVKARGAYVIGVAKKSNELFDYFVSTSKYDNDFPIADALVNVIPFQLLSYFLGVKLGNSPDRPRNLAKSVTVK